jgi:hypothetical protein
MYYRSRTQREPHRLHLPAQQQLLPPVQPRPRHRRGRLLLCLGNEHSVDLRAVLRDPDADAHRWSPRLHDAMALKPERHHFDLEANRRSCAS